MNKTNKLVWIISVVLLCLLGFIFYKINSKPTINQHNKTVVSYDNFFDNDENVFSDGLKNPNSVTTYNLSDYEPGVSEKSIYMIDINNDGKADRITKSFFENWNAHSYYEYKIELNKNGKFVDITPKGLRTVSGADCDLQQIKFVFKPKFKIIMIYRNLGANWAEPTLAKKRVFFLSDDKINVTDDEPLRTICDVKELF